MDTVTILLTDEECMRRAAQCALDWMSAQPDHVPGTKYALFVSISPDGRVTLDGVPGEALPEIRREGIAFEIREPQ